jgi:hypothetical protein
MKIENGKTVSATERELFRYYLSRGLDDIFPFPEYRRRMKAAGVVIEKEGT